jgi:hypothetical protein
MSSDPDQIRNEIEQTQQELSADVDALTEKLSPQRIVERRVQSTRTAMTSVKDKIMGSMGQGIPNARENASPESASLGQAITGGTAVARDSVTSTASSAASAVRSAPDLARRQTSGNPLAAGLIAFGAGWLLSSLLPASAPEQQMAAQVKDFATEQGRPVVQQLGEAGQQAAQQLRESAQQRAQSVKDTATDAASTVSDEAHAAASQVTSQAQDAAGTVREQAGSSGG